MIRIAFLSALLLAASYPVAAKGNWIDVGKPFPLILLPVAGGEEGTLHSIERYRGRKLMVRLFASW